MSMARSLPVKTWKSGRTASRSASRSHSSCRLSDECFAPMHCGMLHQAAVRVEADDAAVRHEHRAELEADEPVERARRAARARRPTPASVSALSPCDGKITGVPPRAAIGRRPRQVRVEVERSRRRRRPRRRRPRSRRRSTCSVRSRTRSRSSGARSCTYPVSMFTAGVRPASRGAGDVRLDAGPVDRAVGRVRHAAPPTCR